VLIPVAVRQDAAGRRTRPPPSRNALSAVFQREGVPLFFFFLNNYSSFCIWFSFGSLLSRGGGDCFFFYLFSGDVDLCCLVEDEGLRAEQTTSSWADQGDFRKGMDRQPESQVRPLSKWG
jgi:hypothetical protein